MQLFEIVKEIQIKLLLFFLVFRSFSEDANAEVQAFLRSPNFLPPDREFAFRQRKDRAMVRIGTTLLCIVEAQFFKYKVPRSTNTLEQYILIAN
jgi:hypothetical protein